MNFDVLYQAEILKYFRKPRLLLIIKNGNLGYTGDVNKCSFYNMCLNNCMYIKLPISLLSSVHKDDLLLEWNLSYFDGYFQVYVACAIRKSW